MKVSLTSYLGALWMLAIRDEMPPRKRDLPVTLSLPVNLRNYYPSKTARNFFNSMNVTAYFFGFMKVTMDLVIPIALIDKNGNTMSYLLSGLFIGVVPSVIRFFVSAKMPLAWAICLMVCVILFAGSVIFRGRVVAEELRRRFHM